VGVEISSREGWRRRDRDHRNEKKVRKSSRIRPPKVVALMVLVVGSAARWMLLSGRGVRGVMGRIGSIRVLGVGGGRLLGLGLHLLDVDTL
jgi:hypothetical protein